MEIDLLSRIIVLRFLEDMMIPPDFWEPVKITANTEKMKCFFLDNPWDCPLCCEQRYRKHILKCCAKEICEECVDNWFGQESVACPYCREDIRKIYDTEGRSSEDSERTTCRSQKSNEHDEQIPTSPVPNSFE
jgi:hypothetical protein